MEHSSRDVGGNHLVVKVDQLFTHIGQLGAIIIPISQIKKGQGKCILTITPAGFLIS